MRPRSFSTGQTFALARLKVYSTSTFSCPGIRASAFGRVLAGFEVPASDETAFAKFLTDLGFVYQEETNSPAYQLFLSSGSK